MTDPWSATLCSAAVLPPTASFGREAEAEDAAQDGRLYPLPPLESNPYETSRCLMVKVGRDQEQP